MSQLLEKVQEDPNANEDEESDTDKADENQNGDEENTLHNAKSDSNSNDLYRLESSATDSESNYDSNDNIAVKRKRSSKFIEKFFYIKCSAIFFKIIFV